MEKDEHHAYITYAINMYSKAKDFENEERFEEAKEIYQVAAKFLIEIIGKTPKDDKNYKEYKSLAKEILSKAENCKENMKSGSKTSIASMLLGKNAKKEKVKDDSETLEEVKVPLTKPTIERRQTQIKPIPKKPMPPKPSFAIGAGTKPVKPAPVPVKPAHVPVEAPKKARKITVSKDLVEKLQENIITPGTTSATFSDIKGQKEVKKAITENIIYPLMNPDLFTGIREPSRAILLYGPPGNGKTLLAKALA